MRKYSIKEKRETSTCQFKNCNYKFIDNRYFTSFQKDLKSIIQCKGELNATTLINISNGSQYLGFGQNDGSDTDSVNKKIGMHFETRWIATLPSPGNPMGACAEPHSLSDALDNMPQGSRIDSILQYPAIATKPCRIGGIDYNKGEIVRACATCQQWSPDLGSDNGYVKVKLDRRREKKENEIHKFRRVNRALGYDYKMKKMKDFWS